MASLLGMLLCLNVGYGKGFFYVTVLFDGKEHDIYIYRCRNTTYRVPTTRGSDFMKRDGNL